MIVPIGMLTSALPITPAGIGVLEATIESLYHVVPAVENEGLRNAGCVGVRDGEGRDGSDRKRSFYWTANEEVTGSLAAAEAEEDNGDGDGDGDGDEVDSNLGEGESDLGETGAANPAMPS